ncbi:MAG: HAD family phosphatase [Candidatus Rokubacteria bacterium]|nr:HAD family phosphatase [Candidatus Rokubacteria bacterium]MBI3825212.1 HAD family phosphatase [Candidatus Rokubacteria bacterium]
MSTTAPAGVVFDMDGVLVDSGAHHREAWQAMLRDVGAPEAPPDFWRLTVGRPSHEAVPLVLGRALEADEARRLARIKQEHYARLARRGSVALAGIGQFLALLAAAGVPRAVATSATRADAERVLADAGLAAWFEVVVTVEDVRRGKPDPEVYVKAAAGIGLAPAACLVFEDAPVGVAAARGAGMRVIGVASAHSVEELCAAGAERAIADFEGLTWPP